MYVRRPLHICMLGTHQDGIWFLQGRVFPVVLPVLFMCRHTHTYTDNVSALSFSLWVCQRFARGILKRIYMSFFDSVEHIFVPCDIQISKYIAKQDLSRMYTYDRFFVQITCFQI